MGRHSGERPHDAPRVPRRRILVLSLLVTLTLVAWGVLVLAAIAFGRDARSGDPASWTSLGIASVGATACLFVTMILGVRLVALVRARQETAIAPRLPGGRHGAR